MTTDQIAYCTAAVALALVLYRPLWVRARHVVTIVHEGAHGVAALASGRRLRGIRLHSDTSGVTVSHGRATGFGMAATLLAGYPGPALLGLLAAALIHARREVAVLWVVLALLALLLVQIRNWFGLYVVLLAGAVAAVVTWWASQETQLVFAYAVAWFLLLAAPRAVVELQGARRRTHGRTSDADQLARLTGLPALVWVGLFLVVTGGALVLGAVLLQPDLIGWGSA